MPVSPAPNLPPDDLPPQQPTLEDHLLRCQLDASLTQRFGQYCDAESREILAACEWSIQTITHVVTLVIICPNKTTNWRVLHQVIPLGTALGELSQEAKLRIYATPQMHEMFEVRVDEISVYQGPPFS